jgi:hypothetical protein
MILGNTKMPDVDKITIVKLTFQILYVLTELKKKKKKKKKKKRRKGNKINYPG